MHADGLCNVCLRAAPTTAAAPAKNPLHQIENQRQSNYCNDQATATELQQQQQTTATAKLLLQQATATHQSANNMHAGLQRNHHTHTPMYVLCCAAEGAATTTAALCRGVHCAQYSFGCSRTVHTYTHTSCTPPHMHPSYMGLAGVEYCFFAQQHHQQHQCRGGAQHSTPQH